MSATSVTGKGLGSSNKPTVKDLAIAANGPAIYFAGIIASADIIVSPPITGNTIVFPYPIPGGAENYVVILTTLNGGHAYVTDLDENSDGDFSGFSFATEAECDLMYAVISCGMKPLVI